MMYKNKKAFSLAELLISLLIISIILAAAIPTVTKRNKYDPERTWQWSGQNNSAYFGVGSDQSAVIGHFKVPEYDSKTAYYDEKVFDISGLGSSHPLQNGDDSSNPAFTTTGDKLNLVKRFPFSENVEYNMRNSHISFYNIRGKNATENDIKYAGRIAADEYNLAFGIGTLASLNAIEYDKVSSSYSTAFKGYNTAIGHYSSILTSSGQYNTALGFAALKNNITGENNTAVGMEALSIATDGKGNDNTAVGAYALKNAVDGTGNTAIGSGACSNLTGNHNICIGQGAGAKGTYTTPVNYTLTIGHGDGIADGKGNGAPLITGVLDQATDDEENPLVNATGTEEERHKQLSVNAFKFNVKPFDGSVPVFEVIAKSGITGYQENAAKFGDFNFTLRDTYGGTDAAQSIQMQMYDGGYISPNAALLKPDKLVKIDIVDHYNMPKNKPNASFGNLLLSETFYFITPKSVIEKPSDGYAHINIHNFGNDIAEKRFLGLLDETVLLQHKGASYVAMEMTKTNGFKVSSQKATGSSYIQLTDNGTNSGLQLSSNGSYFTMNKDGVSLFSAKDLALHSSTGTILFGSNVDTATNAGIWFTNVNQWTADIHVRALQNAGFSQTSLVETIKQIKTKIDDLSARISGYHSDIRLKNVSGDSTAGLKEINALEVKNYTYKNDKEKTPHVGVIAQQLQKIFPNSVFEGDDGYLRIKTEEIFYAMVNSIKELFAQIQDLTAKVVGLDKRLTELEKENAILKKQNADFEKRLSKLEAKMAK